MLCTVRKRFLDGRRFGGPGKMREPGDVVDAEGMRLMRLRAYNLVDMPAQRETATATTGEQRRGPGRPRKAVQQ